MPGSLPETCLQPVQLVRLEPVRSAEPPRNSGRAGASALMAICEALRVAMVSALALAGFDGLGGVLGPVGRQFVGRAALELGGFGREGLGVALELAVPVGLPQAAPFLLGIPGLVDFLGNLEGAEVPADVRAGRRRFRRRRAVRRARRGCPACSGEPTPITVLQQIRVGLSVTALAASMAACDGLRIMAVDVRHHVPAVGFEALRRVVGEPAFDVAVDGDAVVVPEGDQLAQAPGAGQRAGFVRDAFHQAAVAEEDIGVVIDDLVAGLVELGGQQLLGHGHADGVGDALAERAGGGLDARRCSRIPGGPASCECNWRNCFRSSIDRS